MLTARKYINRPIFNIIITTFIRMHTKYFLCKFDDLDPLACYLEDPSDGKAIVYHTITMSFAHHFCDEGYQLIGSFQRNCSNNGNWTGTSPHCVLIGM